MSAAIGSEFHAFVNCLWYGVVLFLVYDGLRVFRAIFRHAFWLIGIEDIIFWIWTALYLFSRFFMDTYGAVRGYQLLGVGIGGTVWEYGCGRIVTKKLIFLIRWLKFRILRCKIFIGMRSLMSRKKWLKPKQWEKRMKEKKNQKRRGKHSKAKRMHIQNKVAIKGITFVVCLLLVMLLYHGISLQKQVKENETRISRLQDAYDAEQERTEEIESLQEYMQSEEYIEKYAKEKIGLVKENEIIFKENK